MPICNYTTLIGTRPSSDLLGDLGLGASGRPPDDGRLVHLHQKRKGVGKLARVQRVLGRDGAGPTASGGIAEAREGADECPIERPTFVQPPARLRLLAV